MTQLCHSGDGAGRKVSPVHRLPLLTLLLCMCATGCRHKVQAYVIPRGALVPVTLEELPADRDEGTIATLPLPDLVPFPMAPPTPPVQRRRPAPPREETQQPATAPTETAPAELAIGRLSTGANSTPQIQQQAQDMISSIVRRIEALANGKANAQRSDLNKVRNFLKQAQQALNTGDMDGARNLAVKAGVLMDDLEKR